MTAHIFIVAISLIVIIALNAVDVLGFASAIRKSQSFRDCKFRYIPFIWMFWR